MIRILIVGHQGLVGRAIHTAVPASFQIEGVTSADAGRPARADLDLVVNAGGRIWGDAENVEHAIMSSAEAAIHNARRSQCPILHIGSSAEYGARTRPTFLDEEAALRPQTAYAKAKVRSWNRIVSKAPQGAVSLRSGLILSRSVSPHSLLGKIRDMAFEENHVFPVPASVLAMERNPIHLDDFSSAVLRVAKRLLTSSSSTIPSVLNCGGDEAISVCDLANQVLSMSPLPYRYPKPRRTGHYELVATNRLKTCTSWKPMHSIRNGDWLR
ncbi:sugar nucleotide-binding protein [Corynebacterium belfantii]|nr:sugar nucleotide-binding protein [Corynebacterium belfantii]